MSTCEIEQAAAQRVFTHAPMVRQQRPLVTGVVGPSFSGKTFSALRLAKGMVRVTGGKVWIVDTEEGRCTDYAELFDAERVPLTEPFSPHDYLHGIEYCIDNGAKVVVVDSMSHEHEGPGGVLEWYEREWLRLGGHNSVKMLAWVKPKAARKRLIQTILRKKVHVIFCYRADKKLEMEKGKDPRQIGWQAITDRRFVFELSTCFLLYPGANGIWTPLDQAHPDERWMCKVPEQFKRLLAEPRQLDEAIGQAMAEWARGAVPEHPLLEVYRLCPSLEEWERAESARKVVWATASVSDKAALKAASEEAKARLSSEQPSTPEGDPPDQQSDGGLTREESLALDARLAEEQQLL